MSITTYTYRYKENTFAKGSSNGRVKASVRFVTGCFEKRIGAVIVDNICSYHVSVNKEYKLVVHYSD